MSDHYGSRGKLTTREILREITGGEETRTEQMIEEMNRTTVEAIANMPPVPRQDPTTPIQSLLQYTAVEHYSTPEGVEQTVKMVAIHAALNNTPTKPPREGDQQLPIRNDLPEIHDLVCGDIQARKRLGTERYGTPLQPHNGRDALRDHYEELLDACAYARQMLYERDGQ